MFSDARSKKLVIVSHCILNQNSISDSTADFPSQYRQIVDLLMNNNIGIIQLGCPELFCLGLNRQDDFGGSRELLQENSRIRDLLETEESQKRIEMHVNMLSNEIKEYLKYGFKILGIIGVNRSPSCGIETTSKGNIEIEGTGVFMDSIKKMLVREGLSIPMVGTKTSRVEESIEAVRRIVRLGDT